MLWPGRLCELKVFVLTLWRVGGMREENDGDADEAAAAADHEDPGTRPTHQQLHHRCVVACLKYIYLIMVELAI